MLYKKNSDIVDFYLKTLIPAAEKLPKKVGKRGTSTPRQKKVDKEDYPMPDYDDENVMDVSLRFISLIINLNSIFNIDS